MILVLNFSRMFFVQMLEIFWKGIQEEVRVLYSICSRVFE